MDGIGAIYADGRRRLTELVTSLPPEQVRAPVPACPGWEVRDVIAHLAGGCADALAGNLDGVTTSAWADAQVAARRDRTVDELLTEWSAVAPQLEANVEAFPPRLNTIWILDLATHEHDVRGALDHPGARGSDAVGLGLEFLINEGLHRVLCAMSLGPLRVRTGDSSAPDTAWVVGIDSTEEPTASVHVDQFELFRALTGRRSRAQIAGWQWTVDPEPLLGAFQFGTFTTRESALVE